MAGERSDRATQDQWREKIEGQMSDICKTHEALEETLTSLEKGVDDLAMVGYEHKSSMAFKDEQIAKLAERNQCLTKELFKLRIEERKNKSEEEEGEEEQNHQRDKKLAERGGGGGGGGGTVSEE